MNLRRNLSKYISLYNYVEAYRTNKLPDGYTRLSYIQGDGTAYIDLGIKLTSNDSIDITLEYTTSTSAKTIFGYRDSASQNNIMVFFATSADSLVLDFNNSSYSEYRLMQSISPNTVYDIVLNAKERSIYSNGTIVGTNTTVNSDNIVTDKVYLFYGNGALAQNSKFNGRIYEFKISDRMDLIPCKDPNNNVGMYDVISGKFFGNVAGSGAFVAGDEIADSYLGFNTVKLKDVIHGKLNELTVYGKTKNKAVDGLDSLIANGGTELIPETYLDTVIAKGKCVQENRLTNGLPSEYQELYYIESTGTQYIDTGIKINSEKVSVKTKVLFPVLENTKTICGSQITTNNGFGGLVFYQTAYGGLGGCFGSSYNNATYQSINANTVYDIEYDANNGNGSLSINGSTLNTTYTGTLISNNNWYIFWSNGGREEYIIKMRMYGIQLYDDNVLVFNGIPVKRKSDGELGIYDTVSKTFFTNAGTGTFTASEDKLIDSTSSDYTILDYVTFDGTQVIDTGVICNEESRIESKWIANSSSMWVYGTGTTNPRITCYCVSSGNERFGNVTVDNTGITNNVLNTLTQDKNGFYYNGTNGKPYSNVGTFTCLDTLTIGNSNGSSGTPLFNGNFYYMRIYDNNVLIRSYVPVKRNSDDVVGFFDTVSGTFITPFEGNALVAGTVKTTWEPTPNFPVDIWCNNGKIDKFGNVIALPSDYTQLEYIESSGTQYIDTGLKLNQNNIVEVRYCYHTESTISTSGRVFGARYTSGSRNSFSIGSNDGQSSVTTAVFSQLGDNSVLALNNIVISQWNTYKLSADGFYISGVKQGDLSGGTFETPFTVKLFAFEQASSSSATPSIGCGVGRCKQFKIWNGNTLVMDLIPAKNASGVVGMYDTVSGTFFTNAGTGDFVAGPTIDNRNVQEVITAPNGKNLFDKNNIQRIYGYFNSTNARWSWATNGNSIKIPCKPNTKYTARYDGTSSVIVLGFGSTYTDDEPSVNNVFVPVTNSVRTTNPTKDTPVTITTGANDKWLIVAWPANELYPDQYEEMRQHIIVEEGETPTEYEAGKGFNTAKCGNLLSVGTYRDTQSILDGTITRNVGVLVLDGTENWTAGTGQYTGNCYCDNLLPNLKRPEEGNSPAICTVFPMVERISDFSVGKGYVSSNPAGRVNLWYNDTATNFKQYLADQYAAGTPVILVYPLATPVTETIATANLNKKEVSVISGSLSISDLEVTSTESEHTIPTPSQPLSLRCNNGTIVTKFHNDDYTRLEYIESTDRLPAINIGARYSAGNDFIVEWSAVDTESQTSGTTLFAATATTPYSGGLYGKNTSRSYYIGSTGTSQSGLVGYASDDGLVHNWKIVVKDTKMDLYKDGIKVGGIDSISGTIDTEHDIYLFCGGWTSASDQTLTQFTKWRLYSWKLTVAGTIVRDLVPAKRNEDNELGMYDKVTDTFFVNCATGSFIGGNIATDVEGTQETIITVKETNLFDKDTCEYINAYVNANTGVLTQGSPGSSTQYCFVIPCKSNTTYKLDGMGTNLSAWGSFTSNEINTTATVYVKGNNTLTTGSNDHYLIGLAYTTGTAIYDYRDTLDIREIDIMAYVENLLAIDSTYVDTQDILTGLVTHTIGIKVLDGTEEYSVQSINTYNVANITGTITDKINGNENHLLTTHFVAQDTAIGVTQTEGILNSNTTGIVYFRIDVNKIPVTTSSATAWKSWLAEQYAKGTPVIVVYPLATATTESVDAQEMRNSPASIKDASMEGLTLTQTHSTHTIPTPTFPLDLVCNNGVIKGVSKNLFDPAESNITVGYWLRNSDGQPESSPANYYYNNFMPVKSNTNYIFFGKKKSDGTLSNYNRISWYDNTKTWISNSTYTMGTIGSGVSPSNAAFARMSCNIDGSTLTTDYVLEWNWMFYEGTEEESFVPYGVITEGNPEVLNIKGKNLYDITKDTTGKFIDANGNISTEPYSSYSELFEVKPGEVYTYSGMCNIGSTAVANNKRIHGYVNGVWNQQIAVTSVGKNTPFYTTFTIPAEINGIRISHWTDDTYTQIEEGIRPTKYEEYMNMDYSVPTLLSVGDFVDTQELQSGIYNSKIGVKVLDGSEEWSNISGYMNISKTYLGSNSTVMPSNSYNIICSHFETKNGTFTDGIGIGGNYVNFKYDSLFTTLAEWQQYLADQYAKGIPVTIVYPLANTITETEESKSIYIDASTNTITRISDSGVGDLEMEVKYKKLR